MSHFAIINTYDEIDILRYKLKNILENIETDIDSQILNFDELIDKIFSTCWNELSHLFIGLPADFYYSPDFYQYLKQHLVIASTYTIRHLCNNKERHANDYIYELISHQLVGVSKQNEQRKIYEFLSNSLDTWSGELLNLSKDMKKNKSSITTTTTLPLFLTQLYQDIHLRDSRIVYKPYKETKTKNATGHDNRHFHDYLENLNYIKYHLIDYDTIADNPVEQILYYYKSERAYGLNLLTCILPQIESEYFNLYIATENQKRFNQIDDTYNSYELRYKTKYLLLLQHLPNVFSRASMLNDLENIHPLNLQEFINTTLPTYESLFLFLLLNYSKEENLMILYSHLKKYIEQKLEPSNADYMIWKNTIQTLSETKEFYLYDSNSKLTNSLDLEYKKISSNVESYLKKILVSPPIPTPKTILEAYFEIRYSPSWWDSIPNL